MSYLGARNAISLGVSYQATLGGPNLLYKLAPSLLLQFAGAETLDSRITFTRTTTATRTNSSGLIESVAINGPRFDYNPTTLAPNGLLIEEQRTNLVTYSEQLDNAVWTKTAVTTTANTTIAPDGTTTADTLTEDLTTSIHTCSRPLSSSGVVTLSVFAKLASGAPFLTIGLNKDVSNSASATFDLSLGTNTQTQVNGGIYASPSATITAVSQGFYRCTFTVTTDTFGSVRIGLNNTGTPNSTNRAFGAFYTGDGTSGIYIWGAQLEAGAFPTSYIPTVASQVTRTADVATMTGTNFSSWYNATEGTLYASYILGADSVSVGIFSVDDATSLNIIQMRYSSSSLAQFNVTAGGVNQVNLAPSGYSAAGTYKRAIAFKVNSFNQAINGVLPTAEDTSGTIPVVTQARIGNEASSNFINGTISQIAFYPRRLANAELVSITS